MNTNSMKTAWTFADARRFVQSHYGPQAEGLTCLGAGEWSTAFAVTLSGLPRVLRFGHFREDFDKDREMGQHTSSRLPIPQVVEVGELPGGGSFALAERAWGTYLDDQDEAGMRQVLPHLLDALETTRDIPVPEGAGYGLWKVGARAPYNSWRDALLAIGYDEPGHRLSGWRHALEASSVGAGAFDTGLRTLERLSMNLSAEPRIIHGDLLYRNVLVDGGHLSAVLDWGNSLFGDPLYDAAWLVFWWPWYPAWAPIDVEGMLRQRYRDVPREEWDRRMTCYQIHIALDAEAYSAFRGRFEFVRTHAEKLRELVSSWK